MALVRRLLLRNFFTMSGQRDRYTLTLMKLQRKSSAILRGSAVLSSLFCGEKKAIFADARKKVIHLPRFYYSMYNLKSSFMPEVSNFYGIVIYMYFNEHQPPHFHVKYGEYNAMITIEDGIVVGSLPRRALNLIYDWLDLHKSELMENWHRLENFESFLKIEPLR